MLTDHIPKNSENEMQKFTGYMHKRMAPLASQKKGPLALLNLTTLKLK